jgi:tRNA pseudouridine38-40 synthase
VEHPAGAATQRWRLLLAYDGAAFRGFAVQPEVPTVAGALRLALQRTARLSEPPALTGAGRTDAGVHARGQVVHVDLPPLTYDGVGLARALNRQLAPDVVVRRAEEVGDDFDARRSATARTYRYLVWNAPAPDPLLARIAWHVRDPLDLVAMRTASDVLLGSHDFRSFCRRKPGTDGAEPVMRTVLRTRWRVDEGPEASDAGAGADVGGDADADAPDHPGARLLRFEISARSFCHQMVRSLVASLVEVGRGKETAAGLMERLRAASRHTMPDPAPPGGLCLVSVTYGDTRAPAPGLQLERRASAGLRRDARHAG